LRLRTIAAAGFSGLAGGALWWRKRPSACPYSQRFWVEAPHPFITRERLLAALAPAAGERILEVGPGTGYYSLTVARALGPDGRLDLFDLQQDMLDHTTRRAAEAGLDNLVPTQGDAQDLPYEEGTFDAAYLVAVLGEVPDQSVALGALHRVLKPGGRLIVGELFGDPHWVSPKALSERATSVGFEQADRHGKWFGYYGSFRKPGTR
jgi:ubiquinone/menaquinone biosynthesis C-methylase UbiE